jgi:hypothetical protein
MMRREQWKSGNRYAVTALAPRGVSWTDGPDTLGKQDLLRFKGGKVSDEVISIVLSCRIGNPIWKFGAQTKWEALRDRPHKIRHKR